MEPTTIAPPPWSLTGEGLVLLFHIPKSFNQRYGYMADYQRAGYIGWVGAVVLADYKTSDVGAYRELIYVPGLFRIDGRLTFSISKIYVSTYDSLRNGQHNWGIPKELAEFSTAQRPGGTQAYIVSAGGKPFFEVRVKPWGPRLPFTTRLIPYTRIMQRHQHQLLLTRPNASGYARLASVKQITADPDFFPPVHLLRPFLALSISEFRMIFPVSEVLPRS